MKLGTKKLKSLQSIVAQQLAVLLLAVSLLLFTSTTQLSAYSINLNPTDQVNPSKSEPVLDKAPESSKISSTSELNDKDDTILTITDQSWWAWLTNSSSKPAYFHYVDFIELIS